MLDLARGPLLNTRPPRLSVKHDVSWKPACSLYELKASSTSIGGVCGVFFPRATVKKRKDFVFPIISLDPNGMETVKTLS